MTLPAPAPKTVHVSLLANVDAFRASMARAARGAEQVGAAMKGAAARHRAAAAAAERLAERIREQRREQEAVAGSLDKARMRCDLAEIRAEGHWQRNAAVRKFHRDVAETYRALGLPIPEEPARPVPKLIDDDFRNHAVDAAAYSLAALAAMHGLPVLRPPTEIVTPLP